MQGWKLDGIGSWEPTEVLEEQLAQRRGYQGIFKRAVTGTQAFPLPIPMYTSPVEPPSHPSPPALPHYYFSASHQHP